MPNLNPIVTEYVHVRNFGNGSFGVFAKLDIKDRTIVEVCPAIKITKKDAIILEKAAPSLRSSIFIDDSVLNKEAEVLTRLHEMKLEERLDRGEITPDQFTKLLMEKIDSASLLESYSHVLLLGNGPLYEVSDRPNLVLEYHSEDKVGVFRAARFINKGTQLTYFKQ